MSQERISQITNEVLHHWGDFMLAVLDKKVKEKKLVLTGDLLSSLRFQVKEATAGQTAKLLLSFEDSGRIRDMKAITFKKMPPISVIQEYVEAIGISKFKYVPGYPAGKFPSAGVAANRIAWGIAKSKLAVNKTKPKKWFSRTFYGTLNTLIDDLLAGVADQSLAGIATVLKDKK